MVRKLLYILRRKEEGNIFLPWYWLDCSGFSFLFSVLTLPSTLRSSPYSLLLIISTEIILPTCTDLLTALCKAISGIFAGAASLPIGLKGPLIFIGLVIGHNAQRFIPEAYPALKLDGLKKDFAVVGCTCGVTGAFLTPIGGVLFAMEEGASLCHGGRSEFLASFIGMAVFCCCMCDDHCFVWMGLAMGLDQSAFDRRRNRFA